MKAGAVARKLANSNSKEAARCTLRAAPAGGGRLRQVHIHQTNAGGNIFLHYQNIFCVVTHKHIIDRSKCHFSWSMDKVSMTTTGRTWSPTSTRTSSTRWRSSSPRWAPANSTSTSPTRRGRRTWTCSETRPTQTRSDWPQSGRF